LDIYKCPFLKSGYKTANDFFQKSDFAWKWSQNQKMCEKIMVSLFFSVFWRFLGVFFVKGFVNRKNAENAEQFYL